MRRAPRRDTNESEIVDALTKCGAEVVRLNEPGVPDLLVGFRQRWYLLEVKLPVGPGGGTSHSDLNAVQYLFHTKARSMGLPCCVVRSVQDALDAVGVFG